MKPTRLTLTIPAQEDLLAMVDTISDEPHLEHGGILIGYYEPERGRVTIQALRRNEYVKPYSPAETTVDFETMALHDREGWRACGSWHSHVYFAQPVEASEGDRDTWLRSAGELGEPYCALVLGPVERWDSGFPGCTWDDDKAPMLGAWLADPNGSTIYRLTITEQPRWMHELEGKIIRRPKEPRPS